MRRTTILSAGRSSATTLEEAKDMVAKGSWREHTDDGHSPYYADGRPSTRSFSAKVWSDDRNKRR